MPRTLVFIVLVILTLGLPASAQDVPKGVDILIPRGGIPAVFEPVFVDAVEAEITPDAWILGVFVGGEAHAYSLNLLNSHEIVNDNVGGTPLAAVW